jgi:hypothetical protein
MARDNPQATQASQTANSFANTYGSNASNIFSDLAPTLEAQASHPGGMSPTDLAAANTNAEQSAGGTQSAAVGQGALRAARTRNAGGGDAATEASARHAGEQLSQAGLNTRLANARIKAQQQGEAESGLGNLYGQSVSGGNQALGEVASNVNANANAENASWDWAKDLFDPIIQAAGQGAGAAAGGGKS